MKETGSTLTPPKYQRCRCNTWLSSSGSSSASSLSTATSTPSPSRSPYRHLQSPMPANSSFIPFSWEDQPGVPKFSGGKHPPQIPDLLLPPPPPLRKKRFENKAIRISSDPFAAALEECAKETPAPATPPELTEFWTRGVGVTRRRPAVASTPVNWVAARLGLFLAMHGLTCKHDSCSVSHATTVRLPRRRSR